VTDLLLNKSYLDEVRRSLRPEFDAQRLMEMTAEPEIYRYRDALAALTTDVADQLERREALITELETASVRTTEMERELESLKGWKRKAQGFRHVATRSREVNATIRELNRNRDFSIATLKARVEELEGAIRAHRADTGVPMSHDETLWVLLGDDA
jgi:chromosome segregation ATPase